tara:strand:- start:1 stop:486 length:486 start_codon:yes stop_codon:yes gene_type:complete
MNDLERLNLQKMIKENDSENNTEQIRTLKHSLKIKDEVDVLLQLKKDYHELAKSNPSDFDTICTNKCSFLFNNYTDIYNKVKKDEINLSILLRLLNVLHSIEEGAVDQHEGSFEVGKLLKQIYIDSALRKAEKLNEDSENTETKKTVEQISWSEFKKQNKH